MTNKYPRASIVTPSFNQGDFIKQTLDSVKNQDYSNIEHIVVDGGSSDETLDILKAYDNTYNLSWISEPDNGQTDAINKGFSMAEGEIIGWLNSDDVYLTRDAISSIVEAFTNSEDTAVLYGDSAIISQDGCILRVEVKPSFNYGHLLRDCFIDQPSVFFRREVIDRHELDADLDYVMDYEFWLRLAQEYRFRHLDRVLSGDRNHPARKIIADRDQMKVEARDIQRRYGQTFGTSYRLGRLRDKAVSGYGRIKGLRKILQLPSSENFACDIRHDHLGYTAYRQLLMRNRDLAS